jgi:hypothetical protein
MHVTTVQQSWSFITEKLTPLSENSHVNWVNPYHFTHIRSKFLSSSHKEVKIFQPHHSKIFLLKWNWSILNFIIHIKIQNLISVSAWESWSQINLNEKYVSIIDIYIKLSLFFLLKVYTRKLHKMLFFSYFSIIQMRPQNLCKYPTCHSNMNSEYTWQSLHFTKTCQGSITKCGILLRAR